ncbi:hemolysin family protein [uncultured Megasphaera sp.]|uniref:hemolysin family protein n=1 Tax=uncultured Megasphaera sp. TaxID=165188 RepID=UPI00258BEECB|nr:hemolysin family protein [uncultured Megasphaera sp.]
MEGQIVWPYVLGFLLCVSVSAWCVMGKFSFVQLRREYWEDAAREGDEKAARMMALYEKPELFLGAAQFGMVGSILAAGALLVQVLRQMYGPLCAYGPSPAIGVFGVCAVSVVAVSFLWVFGELMPKSVGLERAAATLKMVSPFITGLQWLLYPLLYTGLAVSHGIFRRWHLRMTNETDMAHSEDEIRLLVTASHKEGKIDQVESELIDNVFDFADRLAKEIMVPRQDMVCLYTEDTMARHLEIIRQSRHTRYPLCAEDKDHILGLVHIKDVMEVYIHKRSNLRLIKRPILMIPEIMPVSKLLQLMRTRRTYLAIVVDEYGSTVGLIGLEDILEELVGNIRNEHTAEKEEIQPLADGAYEFDGTVLLEDVAELLHIPVEEDVDTDTIGGYVFNLLGHTPSVGDRVRIGEYRFSVSEVRRFRIARLQAVPDKKKEQEKRAEENESIQAVDTKK